MISLFNHTFWKLSASFTVIIGVAFVLLIALSIIIDPDIANRDQQSSAATFYSEADYTGLDKNEAYY